MFAASLLFLLQVSAAPVLDSQPQAPTLEGQTEAVAPPAEPAKEAKPEVVCKMEPVTGSRARKQKVCRTKAYDQATIRTQQQLRDFQNRASMGGPIGVKPGGG